MSTRLTTTSGITTSIWCSREGNDLPMFAKGWNTLRTARHVKRVTGKSLASQAVEIVRLRFGRTRLGPGDYYALDLFDEALSFQEKSRFVGWRASADIDLRLNAAWSRV